MEDKKLEEIEKRNNSVFEFLIDINKDRRRGNVCFIVLVFVLIGLVLGMAIGMFVMSIHCQNRIEAQADRSEKRMYEFLSQYDFEGDIDLVSDYNDNNSGNINVTR